MPDRVKEKLVELQLQADIADNVSENSTQHREFTADFMMANGVTVQDNTEITDEFLKQLRNAPLTVLHEEPTIEVAQEWISVKDRLPEIGQRCLCYKETYGHPSYRLGTYIGTSFSERCAAFKSLSHYGCIGATHWMPLPQPPKGE